MSLSDPNRPDEPHWIPLGVNTVRVNDGPMISIPESVKEAGILHENTRGEVSKYEGYWSYERENGWILLGNQALTNSRNRVRESLENKEAYESGENDGDFKFAKCYSLRQDGRLQLPDMFFSTAEDVDDTFETEEQVVPEQACVKEGEPRYFMTWSEWLHSDPKVAVLFRMDRLPFIEPNEIPGTGGNLPGPQFGHDEGSLEAPDIGLSD